MKLTLCCFTNKTKQNKQGWPLHQTHFKPIFWITMFCFGQIYCFIKIFFKIFKNLKFKILKHHHLDYSQKYSGFKSGLTFFPLFSTALRLVSRNVRKRETVSDHVVLNLAISFPVLNLSGFIFKGRDLCSVLDFKRQWMKCPFTLNFFSACKSYIFCTFSMHSFFLQVI